MAQEEEKKGGKGGEKRGRKNWRPGIELRTLALENSRKCNKHNSNNKVTSRPCEHTGKNLEYLTMSDTNIRNVRLEFWISYILTIALHITFE